MTADEFSSNALSGTDKMLNDLSGLVQAVDTASQTVIGMTENGEIVIMTTGLNKALIEQLFSSLGSIGDVVSPESFEQMKMVIVIDKDHVIRDIVIDMPLTLTVVGINITGNLSLTAQIDLPETVSISIPANGQNYPERTISEAFDNSDNPLLGILG